MTFTHSCDALHRLIGLFIVAFLACSPSTIIAQNKFNPEPIFAQKNNNTIFGGANFIENIGQYDDIVPSGMGTALFGFEEMSKIPVVFTNKGIVHHTVKTIPPTQEEIEEELAKGDPMEEILMHKSEKELKTVRIEWIGGNQNPTIIKGEKTTHHYAYGLLPSKAYGYNTITYKEVYPNIDLELYFPEGKSGYEYNIVASPGADLSLVQLQFSGDIDKMYIDTNGDLKVVAEGGEGFIQHAPYSFEKNSKSPIGSAFNLEGNTLKFAISDSYNKNETIVVDPWVSALTTLSTTQIAYGVQYDFSGNLYAYGGTNFYKVAKYSPTGTLLWTFAGTVSGWPSTGDQGILGCFTVDKSTGNVYIGQGFDPSPGAQVIRIKSTDGTYDNFISTAVFPMWEFWDLLFVCNSGVTSIYAGGGNTQGNINFAVINTVTGATSTVNTTGQPGLSHDQVCGVIDPSTGDLYGVYASTSSASVNNKIIKNASSSYTTPVWNVATGYSTMVEAANGPGITTNNMKALAINDNYLFYYDGFNLKAFNKSTGAGVGSATTISGYTAKQQGGIAVDACNNVYLGGSGVIKVFSFNGSTFSDAPADITLTGDAAGKKVYDVRLDEPNKMLYATGNGFVGMYQATVTCTSIAAVAFSVEPCISTTGTLEVDVTTSPVGADFRYVLKNSGGTIVQQSSIISALNYQFTSVAAGSYIVEVRANESCSGPRANESVSLTVCNGAPNITSSTSVNFAENGTGTVIDTESTDDTDSEGSGLTYSFTGNGVDEGDFSINSSTGIVTFNVPPDFENPSDVGGNNVYNIEVQVCDNGSPSLCDSQAVVITVTNINENLPPNITSGTTATVAENVTGTVLNTESTDDSDSEGSGLTYSFTGTSSSPDEGEFSINGTSGEISFNTPPDFESPTDVGVNNVYDIEVQVCDSGTPSLCDTVTVAITVTNENEAPIITSGTTASLGENVTGSVLNTESTDDADSEGSGLTYSFTGTGSSPDEGEFSINSTSGEISFNTPPDFESPTDVGGNNVYNVEVQVCDSGTPSLCDSVIVAITVTNENEAPTITSGTTATVAENVTGSVLNTESTDDTDSEGSGLTYSFTGTGSSPDEGEFSINGSSGEISFNTPPDFESPTDVGGNNVYDIEVQVCDSGTPSLCDTIMGTITVINENESPIFISASTANMDENTTGIVHNVESTDDTDSEDGTLTYSFTGTANSPDEGTFSIDDTTGVISIHITPDYENPLDVGGNNIYDVEVQVCDSGTPSLCDTMTIAIHIIDENEDCDEDGIPNILDTDDDGDGEADSTDPDDCDASVFSSGVQVDIKLLLSGNYDSGTSLMHDSLRQLNVLPKGQPYENDDYSDIDFAGTEWALSSVFANTGNDAVVDWVIIELRDALDPSIIIASRAAFVQRDGDVVHVDGIGSVVFPNIADGNYYVVARHRNHLGIMTASSLALSTSPISIDFTLMATQTYQRSDAMGSSISRTVMSDGKMALLGGNMTMDNGVQKVIFQGNNADVDGAYFRVLLDPSNVSTLPVWAVFGYYRDDANLDGLTIFQGSGADGDVPFFTVMEHGDNALVLIPVFVAFEQLP